MSTNDKVTCPGVSEKPDAANKEADLKHNDEICEKEEKKPQRKVCFPEDGRLVTQYFEPANPWQDVTSTTKAQLAAEYLESCRCHCTAPIDSVLQQIRELPENTIGGNSRAPRLTLSDCSLQGTAPVDALEALLRKVRFRRLEIDHAEIDDEGAEALFDMIEYYESATAMCIIGPRQFGIRGWQAASWMIKKSVNICELEASGAALSSAHVPALARALRPLTCRLRALTLTHATLAGDPLLSLVMALKMNTSVRELRLGDNELTPADAMQIATLLRYNTRLQLLDLSNNCLQDAGVGEIAKALVSQSLASPPAADASDSHGSYESRGLTFLVLWNNQLTRNCGIHLASILRLSHSLCVLNIGRNALGCDVIRSLQTGRADGGALVSLGLQAARFGPEAAKAIAELIKTDTRLQRLDLRDNKLGVAGLQAILQALKDNTTLTQLDLDDPADTSSDVGVQSCTEAATVARLLRDIRAACRRNEPAIPAPPDRLLRKISLTCHTAAAVKKLPAEEERRVRLRSPAPSPAPSPAGSPIPAGQAHSRFSVTRVTPERESSTESSSPSTPTRPPYCPNPSRFKVIQVTESPQTRELAAQKKSASRFSVTRNYDKMYNPTPPTPPPTPAKLEAAISLKTEHESGLKDADCVKSVPQNLERVKCLSEDVSSIRSANKESTKHIETKSVLDQDKDVSIKKSDDRNVLKVNPTIVIECEEDFLIEPSYFISDKEVLKESSKDVELAKEIVHEKHKEINDPRASDSRVHKIDSQNNNNSIEKYTDTVIITESEINPQRLVKGCEAENITPKDILQSNSELESVIGPRLDNVANSKFQTESTEGFNTLIERNVLRIQELPVTEVKQDNKSEVKEANKSVAKTVDVLLKSNDVHNTEVSKDVDKNLSQVVSDVNSNSDIRNIVKTDSSDIINVSNVKSDKLEQLSHSETVGYVGDDEVVKSETKMMKNSVLVSDTEKVETEMAITVKSEVNKLKTKVHSDQNVCNENIISRNIEVKEEKRDVAIKQIAAITEDLGNLIQEMHDLSTKTRKKHATEDVNIALDVNIVPGIRDNVVLKKNKSESSLDSPDLEVSRLMRKPISAFCDSSSSLEVSGSSLESLNMLDRIPKPIVRNETDTRCVALSTESSIESTSEITPVNLNMSVSSNESVSPIIFGRAKKLHGSLSSLEASVSSFDSARHEKVMVTSADSGIEYSLQNPSEVKEDSSSNEGTLTYSSSFKDPVKKDSQETLTSPKRTSSLLDVPALKSKGLERMRKISWVAPSPSFHIPKPEEKVEIKLPGNLEKLLSLFQHPSSLFSRGNSDEEKKSASNTPPRKDSSLTSSFWSWGSVNEKEKDDKDADSLSEATDSTLSERVQVSFVDESFSKKLDSKTPSTDTENTLSEFQTMPNTSEESVIVTDITTDEIVQNLALSVKDINASSDGEKPGACDKIDLIVPNDLNKNIYDPDVAGDSNQNTEEKVDENASSEATLVKMEEEKPVDIRPRSFASVLKSSGSENSLEKQTSPDTGQSVDKLPSKVIRGIKENISPENTLTSSMTTKALANEFSERQVKVKSIVNAVWEVQTVMLEKNQPKADGISAQSDLAPIANIDETCDVAADDCIQLAYIDDAKGYDDCVEVENKTGEELENVDLGKDALAYLVYEKQGFKTDSTEKSDSKTQGSLAEELREAEIKELLDLSPELVIEESLEVPEVFAVEITGRKSSPVIPERAKIKKSNSLEDLTKRLGLMEKTSPKTKTIAFKVPESTTPRDIPQRKSKLRSRSGSSPKSLPESLNKPCPLTKMDSLISKKKKKVSSLGKIARDSLLALNMSEEEIAEFRRSYKLTSVESLRSLESVSENSQSGTSVDSRCRACLRTSQESLMSLDSITEDCRCLDECEKRAGQSNR